jgi:hypothetical protein
LVKIMDKEWMIMRKTWTKDRMKMLMIIIINNKTILMMKIIMRMTPLILTRMRKKKILTTNKINLIFNKWIKEYVEILVRISIIFNFEF